MRVLIAARLSQLADGQTGLETQDEDARDWAEDNGHEVVATVADTRSGTTPMWERKNLRPWVTQPDLMATYDAIVAAKQDRLSRGKWRDEAAIRTWAEDNRKTLFIVDRDMQWPPAREDDTDAWNSGASQARREWLATSRRYRRMQGKLRKDGYLVGRPPFGYRSACEHCGLGRCGCGAKDCRHHKVLVPTAEGRQYVPEVFQRIADGHTLIEVAAWLTAATGRTFHPNPLASLIRRTTYRGQRRDAGGTVIHECPPLVSDELWHRANASLDGRPAGRRGQRHDLDPAGAALLAGIAGCGNPGCDATGEGPSPMYRYGRSYRCSGKAGPDGRRRGCGCTVPVADADLLMNEAMAGITRPVLQAVFHPAEGHQVELDDISQKLRDLPARGLPDDAEDAGRAQLRSERKRLEGLPAKPAWTEYVPVTDERGRVLTYGARWTRSGQGERRAWLRDAGFALYLSRPDMDVEDIVDDQDLLSRVDWAENERAVLAFRWDSDFDEGLERALPGDDENED